MKDLMPGRTPLESHGETPCDSAEGLLSMIRGDFMRRCIALWTLAAMVFASIAACDDSNNGADSFTIVGVVLDGNTSAPLANVTVTLYQGGTTESATDINGAFEFRNISAGGTLVTAARRTNNTAKRGIGRVAERRGGWSFVMQGG